MPNPAAGAPEMRTPPETGYAPVNGLQMYYEVHGSGGIPLVLLHGGLFNIDLQFGELLPSLAAERQVIAADFQGHGRTNDIDRPLTCADLASDVLEAELHISHTQLTCRLGIGNQGGFAVAQSPMPSRLTQRLGSQHYYCFSVDAEGGDLDQDQTGHGLTA